MPERAPYLRPALAGATATLSGIGLARFAYVPLFPAMVTAGWVDGGGAGLIGAANLAGYLFGVLGGRPLARSIGTARSLDAGMAVAALAFAGCAWNGGLSWLAAWRLLAGMAGGVLMALAGPAVQASVDPARRGAVSGIVISGVGAGVVAASLTGPSLLSQGLPATWLGLAALVLALWAFAHPRWPNAAVLAAAAGKRAAPGARVLTLAYALSGAGIVPPMIYLADYAVRGLGLSRQAAALLWLLFGTGAVCGALIGGRAADRWGAKAAFRAWQVLQSAALALTLPPHPAWLVVAAFASGMAGIGTAGITLAWARELARAEAGGLWASATSVYALAQAGMAFGLAAMFARTGSHGLLFATGLGFSAAGLLAASLSSGGESQTASPPGINRP